MNRINRMPVRKRNPYYGPVVADASLTVGVEATNAINVAIQLKDNNGNDLNQRGHISMYLSNDSHGDSLITTAPSSGFAIGTDGLISNPTTKSCNLTSESDGDIDLTFTESGALTFYLILVMPDGRIIPSGVITFV